MRKMKTWSQLFSPETVKEVNNLDEILSTNANLTLLSDLDSEAAYDWGTSENRYCWEGHEVIDSKAAKAGVQAIYLAL